MPEGIPQFQQRYGIAPSGISYLTHGTTVGVNAVVQRKGLKPALFATEGFCDVLEVAGLKGGRADANSQFHRNRGQPDEEVLGNRDIGHCNPGDVIRIISAGTGSGGDPLDRPADEAPDLPATAAERARANCSTTATAAPPSRWSGRSSATTC